MISLFCEGVDPFSRYGIRHFFKKFGIPVSINQPSSAGIVVSYGEQTRGDFSIRIRKKEIPGTPGGRILYHGRRIPIFQLPDPVTADGEILAEFEGGDVRYPCIVRTEHGIEIGIDIFSETGHILAGHIDTIRPGLPHDEQEELASIPVADALEEILFQAILDGAAAVKIPLVRKSFWPGGKAFAVCLTHDVDEIRKTYQWISRPLRYLRRMDFRGFRGQIRSLFRKVRGFEPYDTYDDIIGIERELGARSTYYILNETGKLNLFSRKTWYLYGRNRNLRSREIRALIGKLYANGDEVALHGSYFSYLDAGLLKRELQELEGITGEKILGSRQHNLNLEIPATWDHHLEAGLVYDTTLGFRDTIGFRWGTSFPFFPNCGKNPPLRLLQIPTIIMDICLESRKEKLQDCLRIAGEVERYHGVLNLLWHPPIFNTAEYGDEREIYLALNRFCQDRGAWISRARDICQWSETRNRGSFIASFNGQERILTIDLPEKDPVQYLTLSLSGFTSCTILSGNAGIIRLDGDRVDINAGNVQNNTRIIVGFS